MDVTRGVAILSIVLMNVPWQAGSIPAMLDDVRRLGWSAADRATWIALEVLVEGTQRCLLEFLFGAGMLLLSARLDARDYRRRTLWLLAFGLTDIFLILWIGDILAAYALTGLLVFPLRHVETKWLVGLGLGFALWSAGVGGAAYAGQRAFDAAVAEAEAAPVPSAAQARTLGLARSADATARRLEGETAQLVAEERRAHEGGLADYARWYWQLWVRLDLRDGLLIETIGEAAATMLLGMVLLRAGVIQGERSARFYLAAAAACYVVGLSMRAVATGEVTADVPGARIGWIVAEPARLMVGLGHLCAINLLWRTARGRVLLRPFAAAGRAALSLYLLVQVIGLHLLFAPYGLNLWGRFGWAGMTALAVAIMVMLLIVANLWLRRFPVAPAEWLWRRLASPR